VGMRPGDLDFGKAIVCPKHRQSGQKVEPDMGGFYEMVGVPKRYRGVEFSDFDPGNDRMALSVAKQYVKNWPPVHPFLTFQSENKGNGKTMLAVSVLTEAHRRHRVNSRFWPVIDLLERYRQAYQSEETLEKIDTELRRVPLLVLDDLGAEKGTDWTRERLYSLINARYNDLAPTLVTTNIDPGLFDERIASRLLDKKTGAVVTFVGKDRRAA
jgi:DNA replication protein DnaC